MCKNAMQVGFKFIFFFIFRLKILHAAKFFYFAQKFHSVPLCFYFTFITCRMLFNCSILVLKRFTINIIIKKD